MSRSICLSLFAVLLLSCHRPQAKPTLVGDTPSTGAAATPVAPLGPPLAIPVSPTEKSAPLLAKPLTSSGDNGDAHFSADGQRILFVSRGRPLHKQAQVYELHIGQMTEKRVTFHDGDDSDPVYLGDDRSFAFASSTDEIKEEPYAVSRLMKSYYPEGLEKRGKDSAAGEVSEIYIQALNGRAIERITKSPGLDTDVDADTKGKRLVFSSDRDAATTQIYVYTVASHRTNRVSEGKFSDRGARFSPDGKSLIWWRRLSEPAGESQLVLATGDFRKTKTVTSSANSNIDPAWHPNGDEIVFASDREGGHFNLYVIDRAGTCLRRLSTVDFDQLQPTFSPDGKSILFTAKRTDHLQIFMMEYRRPDDCWHGPTAPAVAPTPTPAPTPPAA